MCTKKCIKCNLEKELNNENFHYSNIDKNTYKPICRQCRNKRKIIHPKIKNEDTKLYCHRCQNFKNENEFGVGAGKSRNYRKAICKSCHNLENRNIRMLNSNNFNFFIKKIYNSMRYRSKKYSQDIDFDIQYLIDLYNFQNGKCAISGIEMTFLIGEYIKIPTNISIDRIDSSKGYIKDNIHLVCTIINTMKNNLTLDDFKMYITLTYNNINNNEINKNN